MDNLLNITNDDWTINDGVLKDCWIENGNISVPNGVIEIANCGMAFNNYVHTIRVSASVKLIRRGAFAEDESLREVYIENPNVVIENGAFSDVNSLEAIYIGGQKIDVLVTCDELNKKQYYCLEKYIGRDESYVVDDDIAEIGKKSFYNNVTLKKLRTQNRVERIEEEAFCGCRNLEEVELYHPLYSIADRAFAGCVNIRELKLPSSVWNIQDEAFDRWGENQRIFVPKYVKKASKNYKWAKGCKAKIIFY